MTDEKRAEVAKRLADRYMAEHREALALARKHLTDAAAIGKYAWSTAADVALSRRAASEWTAKAKELLECAHYLRGA